MKYIFYLLIILISACHYSVINKNIHSASPNKLLIMVFDQMRPDYIDRFNLENFKKVRKLGTNYTEAYVGHMASITVLSHPVITTGLSPKKLPWQDSIFYDRDGTLGKKGLFYSTTSLSLPQFISLLTPFETNSLPALMKKKFGKGCFSVGSKAYAAATFGGPSCESIITFKKLDGVCHPSGTNVPSYISQNHRFTVPCSNHLNTEKSFHPLDGSRLVEGDDPEHQGGDQWVGDIAKAIIEKSEWSTLLLSFPSIDRMGHLLGDLEQTIPHPFLSPQTFEDTLKKADYELGKILSALQTKGIFEQVEIVITSDHGAQFDRYYLGEGEKPGKSAIVENATKVKAPFWIERLSLFAKIRASVQDTAVRIWIDDFIDQEKFELALSEISGVIECYKLEKTLGQLSYRRFYSNLPPTNSSWSSRHQELVDSMAGQSAPDYVALLADGVGFGLLGDHGGAQELVQKIPLIVINPLIQNPKNDSNPMRLQDIHKLVSKDLKL